MNASEQFRATEFKNGPREFTVGGGTGSSVGTIRAGHGRVSDPILADIPIEESGLATARVVTRFFGKSSMDRTKGGHAPERADI
ncbi:hypothetical protein [Paraburkholderia caribensis]|uniref:hypothetical protein n=1 Tax=Paraburkholderia caribensis TaxID=75105 RepID=UPI0034D1C6F0